MILKTLLLQPLGPALVLVIGGLLLAFARRLVRNVIVWTGARPGSPPTPQPWLFRLRLPFALATVVSAAAILLWIRKTGEGTVLHWTWQPLTVAGSTVEWRLDGWNWLIAGLALLLAAVVLLVEENRRIGSEGLLNPAMVREQRLDLLGAETERTLWLAAAVTVFVSSGNVLTLATSWVILDAALAFRLNPGVQAEPAGRAWASLSLAALILVLILAMLGENGIQTPLNAESLGALELALLWLLALIRAGVYPLHYWLIGPGAMPYAERIALSIVGPMTGLWLLARVHGIAGPAWLRRPEWMALGALALLSTALVAWTVESETWRWRWIALNRSSIVVLAAYVAGLAGAEALVWPIVAFVLSLVLLAVGQALREHSGWRWGCWIGAVAVWGLPLTPGFLARTALVFPTELSIAIPLFGIVLLAEALLFASVWQAAAAPVPLNTRPNRSNWRIVRLTLAFALLVVPVFAWGLAPRLLATAVGWPHGEAFIPLGQVILTARRSVWIGLIVAAIIGVTLGIYRQRIFGQMRGWQSGIAAIVSLEWLYQSVAAGLAFAAKGLQYFATLGEGEGYLGWLALAGLILWALLRAQ
jgi:hypothetical protein